MNKFQELLLEFLLGLGALIGGFIVGFLLLGMVSMLAWAVTIIIPFDTFFVSLLAAVFLWLGRHELIAMGRKIRTIDDK